MKKKIKNIMVDMSATLLHHGHIRLLKKASLLGNVIVGLSTDEDIYKIKGYKPELDFKQRKEILLGIRYVNKVVKVKYYLNMQELKKHKIDYLIHGQDNSNEIHKNKLILVKRTSNISSSTLRKRAYLNYKKINKKFK